MITAEELTTRRAVCATSPPKITFRCEPGAVTGFLGPKGSGKTTTTRMLVGPSAPDSGRALSSIGWRAKESADVVAVAKGCSSRDARRLCYPCYKSLRCLDADPTRIFSMLRSSLS